MKTKKFLARKRRTTAKIARNRSLPRLSVFRSNKAIYAQIIDDIKRKTLVSVSTTMKTDKKGKTLITAQEAGEAIAKKALVKKIKKVVFDKGGYKYHGKIKDFADGARKGGLVF